MADSYTLCYVDQSLGVLHSGGEQHGILSLSILHGMYMLGDVCGYTLPKFNSIVGKPPSVPCRFSYGCWVC